jgi:hypothetical protein
MAWYNLNHSKSISIVNNKPEIQEAIRSCERVPINIPDNLPAYEILTNENIFVMTEERAIHQDIRPLRIAIFNIMPTKIVTETQLLRLVGNSPLQVDIVLLHPRTYKSRNTPEGHLKTFYKTFDQVRNEAFDGLIITGAPVEHMDFEDVGYWDELKEVMEWSRHKVLIQKLSCLLRGKVKEPMVCGLHKDISCSVLAVCTDQAFLSVFLNAIKAKKP